MDFSQIFNRMIRASRLDVAFYNEVEGNPSLNQEALIVVIITALASGIGSLLSGFISPDLSIGAALIGMIVGIIMGVIGYYIWAYLTYWIGTSLFSGTADVGELLRTLGYATAPRALGIVSFIPCVGPLIALVGAIWSLVAGVIAVREALDFDTGKAVLTVVIGWLVVFIITALIGTVIGVGAVGIGALTNSLN